jgi:hypothetical protein
MPLGQSLPRLREPRGFDFLGTVDYDLADVHSLFPLTQRVK